jgi:hypothetical protein
VDEYARVTKPGGYVGLNESTWLKTPPPPELVDWVSQDIGATVEPLTVEEWTALMEGAGLKDLVVQPSGIDIKDEARGLVRRYGCGGILGVYARIFTLYLRNPAYREFLREVRKSGGIAPDHISEYFGYGLYVGRK